MNRQCMRNYSLSDSTGIAPDHDTDTSSQGVAISPVERNLYSQLLNGQYSRSTTPESDTSLMSQGSDSSFVDLMVYVYFIY